MSATGGRRKGCGSTSACRFGWWAAETCGEILVVADVVYGRVGDQKSGCWKRSKAASDKERVDEQRWSYHKDICRAVSINVLLPEKRAQPDMTEKANVDQAATCGPLSRT